MSTQKEKAAMSTQIAKATARTAALLAGVFTVTTAGAFEWQTTPTVALASASDDNFRMRRDEEREVSSSRLDASANVEGSSDRLTLSLRPRVHAINYSDDREYDRTNKFLYTSLGIGGERQRVTLSADYVRDGTLTNALEDTGFTEVDADRDRSIYGLEWAAATSERGTFFVTFNSHDVTYVDELIASPLVDYDYAAFGLSYAHRLSERSTFSFSLSAGELNTETAFGDTQNVGLSLSFERALSETLTMRIAGGSYATRRPGWMLPEQRDASLDFSLAKQWDRWNVTTSISADIEPSAFGVLFRRETAGIRIGRRFSERVDMSLGLSGGRVQSDQQMLFPQDRRYAAGQLNVNWRVAERLWLSFDVGSRGQEFLREDRSRAAFGQVAFTYRGRGS